MSFIAPFIAGVLPLSAQSRFASSVIDYSPGANANAQYSDPARVLDGPRGGGLSNGSLDILALGIGGEVTVGFDVTIVDGPGADLIVSENGFTFGTPTDVFAELAFVEVSTDGSVFARFPTRYAGPVGPLAPFGTSPMGTFSGLCGSLPGLANVVSNSIDPFDPVRAGGEALDLADLAQDPLVISGAVDLDAIHYVRLVDLEEGLHQDSFGNLIWDHGGPSGSADIDAISVVQHAALATGHQPIVDLRWTTTGHAELFLGDEDGFSDLDLSTLSASVNLQGTSFNAIRPLFRLAQRTPQGVLLRTHVPLIGAGVRQVIGVSVRDHSGQFSGDQLVVPD